MALMACSFLWLWHAVDKITRGSVKNCELVHISKKSGPGLNCDAGTARGRSVDLLLIPGITLDVTTGNVIFLLSRSIFGSRTNAIGLSSSYKLRGSRGLTSTDA